MKTAGPSVPPSLAAFDVVLPDPAAPRAQEAIGATVAGVTVEALTPEVAADLRGLVYEHKLLSFLDLPVDEERYLAFARALGRPQVYFQHNYHHPDHPEIFVSSNVPYRGTKIGVSGTGAYWHSDCSFFDEPLSLTMVTPRILPAGRATLYQDLVAGAAALPEGLRARLAGLRAVHEAKWRYKVQPCDVDKSLTELLEAFDELAPAVTHPALITHPVNGRRALYVSGGFVVGFEGLARDESDALLAEVVAHLERPELVHHHEWRADEIVLWDNRQLNHKAGEKYADQQSMTYRIGVYDDLDFYAPGAPTSPRA